MKVTPLNIARFWKHLMFPPHHELHVLRFALKAEAKNTPGSNLPWEPWLHCAVWLGVITTLIFGEVFLVPPGDVVDWVWIVFGLVSPVVGFSSQWMLEFCQGRYKYIGLWVRMVADIGLAIAMFSYLVNHLVNPYKIQFAIMSDVVVFFCAWFTLTLVSRDIRFLVTTERIANALYEQQQQHLPLAESVVDEF